MTSNSIPINEKSVNELFAEALAGDYDDDEPWKAVQALRDIGSPEVFKMAVDFCNSSDPLKRARGMQVLAQLGVSMENHSGPYLEERVSIALNHLSDGSEEVVEAAAWALSHLKTEKAKNGLLTVRRSSNADVRHAVASGLAGESSSEAVEALIELMKDPVDYVRDWATFSLGCEYEIGKFLDSPEIRKAFHDRLTDTDEDARNEAIWGLVSRKDPIGLRMLLERLEADKWLSGDEDAAINVLDMPTDSEVASLRNGLRQILRDIESNAEKIV